MGKDSTQLLFVSSLLMAVAAFAVVLVQASLHLVSLSWPTLLASSWLTAGLAILLLVIWFFIWRMQCQRGLPLAVSCGVGLAMMAPQSALLSFAPVQLITFGAFIVLAFVSTAQRRPREFLSLYVCAALVLVWLGKGQAIALLLFLLWFVIVQHRALLAIHRSVWTAIAATALIACTRIMVDPFAPVSGVTISSIREILRSIGFGIGIEQLPYNPYQLTTSFPQVTSDVYQSLTTFLQMSSAPFSILIVIGAGLALVGIIYGWRLRSSELLLWCALPWCGVVAESLVHPRSSLHALSAYPFFLLLLSFVPIFVAREQGKDNAAPLLSTTIDFPLLATWKSKIVSWCAALTLLITFGINCVVVVTTETPPSWDEAQYLTAGHQFYSALITKSPSAIFASFQQLISTKPPLVSMIAGIHQLLWGDSLRVAMSTQLVILVFLAAAAFSLFSLLLSRSLALVATAFLVSMPLVTGLTQHFYTENLLVAVTCAYLAILCSNARLTWMKAVGLGFFAGLGLLTKSTFGSIILLPSILVGIYWLTGAWNQSHRGSALVSLVAKCIALCALALVIALPWYIPNFEMAQAHSLRSFWIIDCGYPTVRAFFSMISSGPYFWQSLLTLLALTPIMISCATCHVTERHNRVLLCIVLVFFATFLSSSLAINKAVRFSATWLPFFALVTVFAVTLLSRSHKSQQKLFCSLLFVCPLLVAHNSFGLLGSVNLKIFDLRLIDSQYPLNVPDWFDDNAPRDTREYNLGKLVRVVGDDARLSFPTTLSPIALLTADCLYFNHNVLGYLSRAAPVWFLPWTAFDANDSAVKYVIMVQNGASVCKGRFHSDHGEKFLTKLRSNQLSFQRIAVVSGIGETRYLLFRRQ